MEMGMLLLVTVVNFVIHSFVIDNLHSCFIYLLTRSQCRSASLILLRNLDLYTFTNIIKYNWINNAVRYYNTGLFKQGYDV